MPPSPREKVYCDSNPSALDYGNEDSVNYTYDDKGRILTQTYEDGDTVTYTYNNDGDLAIRKDSATGITTKYYYDLTGRLMKYEESGTGYSHSVGYEYDTLNNLTELVEYINGTEYTTTYTYDDDNRVSTVTQGDLTESYTYDGFGRVSQKKTSNANGDVKTETYTFTTPSAAGTSSQVASYETVAAQLTTKYSYSYDDNGNILSVTEAVANGMARAAISGETTYVYDSANQLIRENNLAADKTWTWTYDDAGNILCRKEYTYTTEENLDSITPTDTVTYTYGAQQWGDLLTNYDGTFFNYDDIGNLTDDGTWEYTWEHGRQLASMSDGTTTWDYAYNADGMRTKRTDGNTTYSYVYNGSQLVRLTISTTGEDGTITTDLLEFKYDASGRPATMTYNGTLYYYVTNLQGDVIALVDSNGYLSAYYIYNAWGKLIGGQNTPVGNLNPLRYRGYVYDNETELYYLQSRYYNPEIGRYINADSLIDLDNFPGHNLFAYCDNSSVIKTDYTGEDGKYFEIGRGWYYRIDPQDTSTGTQRHIHIWNEKKGTEYIQNEDGSPHDKSKGSKGKLSSWLNKKLRKDTGWDYNANRESFFEKTEFSANESNIRYTFADGTVEYGNYSFTGTIPSSVSSLESIYFGSKVPVSNHNVTSKTVFIPIFGSTSVPVPSFGFYWGPFPIPILP